MALKTRSGQPSDDDDDTVTTQLSEIRAAASAALTIFVIAVSVRFGSGGSHRHCRTKGITRVAADPFGNWLPVALPIRSLERSYDVMDRSKAVKQIFGTIHSERGRRFSSVVCVATAATTTYRKLMSGSRTISPLLAPANIVLNTLARKTQFRTEAMTSRIAQLVVIDALIAVLALGHYDRSVATIDKTFDVLSTKRI